VAATANWVALSSDEMSERFFVSFESEWTPLPAAVSANVMQIKESAISPLLWKST